MDLRWNGRLSVWTGGHEQVEEGRYALMIDAAVDDLVLWRALETELEVVSEKITLFEFSIQDSLHLEGASASHRPFMPPSPRGQLHGSAQPPPRTPRTQR